LARFQAGEPPLASITDMVTILQVVNAAVESARTGSVVDLKAGTGD